MDLGLGPDLVDTCICLFLFLLFIHLLFLVVFTRSSCLHSGFQSKLNSSIVSYYFSEHGLTIVCRSVNVQSLLAVVVYLYHFLSML